MLLQRKVARFSARVASVVYVYVVAMMMMIRLLVRQGLLSAVGLAIIVEKSR